MNNKGVEINVVGIVIGCLAVGLFFGAIGYFIISGQNYDTTGYDADSIGKYDKTANLTATLNSAYADIDKVTVDPNIFDFFAGIFNKILAPFKTVYRSIGMVISLTSDSVQDLGLPKFIGDFFYAAIVVIIIIGLVMLRIYMNRYA